MAWTKHPPTVYLVSWDDTGIVKIGTTNRQRWRKFTLRGARLVETWQFPDHAAYAFETSAQVEANRRWPRAFPVRGPAAAILGTGASGWRECYTAPAGDALAMLQAMHPHYAPSIMREHPAEHCYRAMQMHGARTDGRTD